MAPAFAMRRYHDPWTITQSCDARDLARLLVAKAALNAGAPDDVVASGMGLSRRTWFRLKARIRELERAGRG